MDAACWEARPRRTARDHWEVLRAFIGAVRKGTVACARLARVQPAAPGPAVSTRRSVDERMTLWGAYRATVGQQILFRHACVWR